MRALIFAVALLVPIAVNAAETIVASVNGMVCALCVVGIEKSFKKVPAVDTVKVDLDKKTVTVHTKEGQVLDDALVTKTIVKAGYAVKSIARTK